MGEYPPGERIAARAVPVPSWILDAPISWAAKAHYLAGMAVFARVTELIHGGASKEEAFEEFTKIPGPADPGVMPLLKELETAGAVEFEWEGGQQVCHFILPAD